MFGIKQEKKPFFNNREAKLTFYSLCKVMFVQSSLQCCVLAHLWIASGTHHKKRAKLFSQRLGKVRKIQKTVNMVLARTLLTSLLKIEGYLAGRSLFVF